MRKDSLLLHYIKLSIVQSDRKVVMDTDTCAIATSGSVITARPSAKAQAERITSDLEICLMMNAFL